MTPLHFLDIDSWIVIRVTTVQECNGVLVYTNLCGVCDSSPLPDDQPWQVRYQMKVHKPGISRLYL